MRITIFVRFVIMFITGTAVITGISSCKKHSDDASQPIITNTQKTVSLPALKMLTAQELNGSKPFHASAHFAVGKGLYDYGTPGVDGKIEPWLEVAGLLFDIHDFIKKSPTVNFSGLSNQISGLSEQIDSIKAEVNQLMVQLQFTQQVIILHIDGMMEQTAFSPIESAYSGNIPSLKFFASQAKFIQSGPADSAMPLTIVQSQIDPYVSSVTNPTTGMGNSVQQIHDIIVPDKTLNGTLKDFTDFLILNTSTNGGNMAVHDTANAMFTYKLLENYFLKLIGHQMQALTILVNAYNYQDTTGQMAKYYIGASFRPLINDEIIKFFKTVDYLALNIYDYRDANQYGLDMQFSEYGVALMPNCINNFVARSRFVGALLKNSLNDPNPITVCGSIAIPSFYTEGTSMAPTSLAVTLGGGTQSQDAGSSQLGTPCIYPYTHWTEQAGTPVNTGVASPDNHYTVFNFIQSPPVIKNPTDILLMDNSNLTTPWYHTDAFFGDIPTLWYDPVNPRNTSASPQAGYIPFAFFGLRWMWGYQRLSMSPISYWRVPQTSESGGWVFEQVYGYSGEPNPLVSYNAYDGLLIDSLAKYCMPTPASLNYPLVHALTYMTPYTSQYTLTTNTNWWNFIMCYALQSSIMVEPPPGGGSSVSLTAFANASTNYFPLNQPNKYFWIYAGTGTKTQDGRTFLNNNIFSSPNGGWSNISLATPCSLNTNVPLKFQVAGEGGFYNNMMYVPPVTVSVQRIEAIWNLQLVYQNTYNIFN